jgi:outer membrane lipoprotein SlyB
MVTKTSTFAFALLVSLFTAGAAQAANLMSVAYGTITGIAQQERDTAGGSTAGTLLGGIAGLASGSGRSTSNRALRTLGGAAVGRAAGGLMARGTEMVFTVALVTGGTVRVVMDEGSFHRGDCVAVEQGGAAANMRRVSSEFCSNNARVPEQHKAEHRREATECANAMDRLLSAQNEEEVRTAEMIMNIVCQD